MHPINQSIYQSINLSIYRSIESNHLLHIDALHRAQSSN